MCQESFKDVSKKFQVCKNVSSESYVLKSFKGISRKNVGCFKGVSVVSRVFEIKSKGIPEKFQRCFKEVSRVFQVSF